MKFLQCASIFVISTFIGFDFSNCFNEPSICENYSLEWSIIGSKIRFVARVQTGGWVGLGLNSQPTMNNAELMIAGVKDKPLSTTIRPTPPITTTATTINDITTETTANVSSDFPGSSTVEITTENTSITYTTQSESTTNPETTDQISTTQSTSTQEITTNESTTEETTTEETTTEETTTEETTTEETTTEETTTEETTIEETTTEETTTEETTTLEIFGLKMDDNDVESGENTNTDIEIDVLVIDDMLSSVNSNSDPMASEIDLSDLGLRYDFKNRKYMKLSPNNMEVKQSSDSETYHYMYVGDSNGLGERYEGNSWKFLNANETSVNGITYTEVIWERYLRPTNPSELIIEQNRPVAVLVAYGYSDTIGYHAQQCSKNLDLLNPGNNIITDASSSFSFTKSLLATLVLLFLL